MKFAGKLIGFLLLMTTFFSCKAKELMLVKDGKSTFVIVLPDEPTAVEQRAATTLQSYLKSATGFNFNAVKENSFKGEQGIFIGKCKKANSLNLNKAKDDGFSIIQSGESLFIVGNSGQGTATGIYYFLEKYMGCRKYDGTAEIVPKLKVLTLPAGINDVISPAFVYRQSYYPQSNDAEYLRWHGLQKFEDLWGLWGHSFFKLVPPAQYFETNPEYYALVNGQRRATQLCLSNEQVLRIAIARFKELIADNPDAMYWSVSPNDEGGYCTCNLCKKVDDAEGTPSGSLIKFVNKIAAAFPDKNFTTLGYGYTSVAPKTIKPAKNVSVFVSSIDAFRNQPIEIAASAADFRKNLTGWATATDNIFVWDYSTQFTNYLSPFPAQHILAPNFDYFKRNNVRGIFEQGSGDTYSDMAELNSYIQAKLLWNVETDVAKITEDFCKGYYGKAAPFVLQYLNERQAALIYSKRHLDIYGNPITDLRGYLSPDYVNKYQQVLENAAKSVASESIIHQRRVQAVRLSLDYVSLQQSRHFGVEQYGFLEDKGLPDYSVKSDWSKRVADFITAAENAGVTELSEAGLSPDKYQAEWDEILAKNWPANPIRGAAAELQNSFVEDYPAKGKATLTDGMTGFSDFSYNWLCFYGNDMVATIDAGKEINVGTVSMNFINDQRHWIFPPVSVKVEISSDGNKFTEFIKSDLPPLQEQEKVSIALVKLKNDQRKARYIRVTATCPKALPDWRSHPTKKPMIACDEIFVLP